MMFYSEDCVEGAKKYLQSDSIDLIISDPPYGINGDKLDKHYNRDESNVLDGYVEIPEKEYPEFSEKWIKEAARVLCPGGSIYIVSGYSQLRHILNALANTTLQEKITLFGNIILAFILQRNIFLRTTIFCIM
jgi:site-specific DNA-methyltransferase (adenine-specific)